MPTFDGGQTPPSLSATPSFPRLAFLPGPRSHWHAHLATRRRLGPKRASKIRKLFALSKDDDVRKYVIRRELPSKTEGKKGSSKVHSHPLPLSSPTYLSHP